MRKLAALIASVTAYFSILGQTASNVDSLNHLLQSLPTDTTKAVRLIRYSYTYVDENPGLALTYAQEALIVSNKLHSAKHEVLALNSISHCLFAMGNYSKALKSSLDALTLAEKLRDTTAIASACNNIGNIYKRQMKHGSAIQFFMRSKQLYEAIEDEGGVASVMSNIGSVYLNSGQTDSALYYQQTSFQKTMSLNQTNLPLVYNRLGDVYYQLQNTPVALGYYQMGIRKAIESKNTRWLCFNFISLANLFAKENNIDSSVLYAKKGFNLANGRYLHQQLEASRILSDDYSKLNVPDSTVKYLRLSIAINDSINNNIEESNIQNLLFETRLEKQKVEDERLREKQEQAHNLQYIAIAIGVVTFIIFFFLLSHSIIANQRLIKFLGILALLIVFEFLNLLLHPYIGRLTHDAPVMMLGIMVAIAAFLIPLHHKLEHWITHRLVEKNKKIRLAAARKTIEQLEEARTHNSSFKK